MSIVQVITFSVYKEKNALQFYKVQYNFKKMVSLRARISFSFGNSRFLKEYQKYIRHAYGAFIHNLIPSQVIITIGKILAGSTYRNM